MIRYRHDPDNPDTPIIEATPRAIDPFRKALRSYLNSVFPSLPPDSIEDIIQLSMLVACRALAEGTVRGRHWSAPESALRAWLTGVACRLAMNERRASRCRTSMIAVSTELDGVDARSLPEDIVDARRMLERIAQQTSPRVMQGLLLFAQGATQREIAQALRISPKTLLKELGRLRTGDRPDEPEQPRPSRSTKRKR